MKANLIILVLSVFSALIVCTDNIKCNIEQSQYPDNAWYIEQDSSVYLSETTGSQLLTEMQHSYIYSLLDALESTKTVYLERLDNIGTSVKGNEIRCYEVKSLRDISTKKIVINTGTHGDEKSAVLGVAQAVGEMLKSNESWFIHLLSAFSIVVIPCLNPDGFDSCTRENANGVDINRDFLIRRQPETQSMYAYLNGHLKEIYALYDFHNTTYVKGYGVVTQEYPYIAEYSSDVETLNRWLTPEWKKSAFSICTEEPFFYLYVLDNTEGRLHNLMNLVWNKRCYTLEVPRNHNFSLTNEASSSEACKTVKELVINQLFLCWRRWIETNS